MAGVGVKFLKPVGRSDHILIIFWWPHARQYRLFSCKITGAEPTTNVFNTGIQPMSGSYDNSLLLSRRNGDRQSGGGWCERDWYLSLSPSPSRSPAPLASKTGTGRRRQAGEPQMNEMIRANVEIVGWSFMYRVHEFVNHWRDYGYERWRRSFRNILNVTTQLCDRVVVFIKNSSPGIPALVVPQAAITDKCRTRKLLFVLECRAYSDANEFTSCQYIAPAMAVIWDWTPDTGGSWKQKTTPTKKVTRSDHVASSRTLTRSTDRSCAACRAVRK